MWLWPRSCRLFGEVSTFVRWRRARASGVCRIFSAAPDAIILQLQVTNFHRSTAEAARWLRPTSTSADPHQSPAPSRPTYDPPHISAPPAVIHSEPSCSTPLPKTDTDTHSSISALEPLQAP